jgi:hypothetical protein
MSFGLRAFIGEVERALNPEAVEDSLRGLSSSLRDLTADRCALSRYLETSRVEMSPAGDQTVVLWRGEHYLIRAAIWPTAVHWWPRSWRHVYNPHIAHTHQFAILTVGYLGPGYRMTSYRLDPEPVPGVGERVELRERYDHPPLAVGETRLYAPFTFAHSQRPPTARSVSLSLVAWPPNPCQRPALFVDTDTLKRVA